MGDKQSKAYHHDLQFDSSVVLTRDRLLSPTTWEGTLIAKVPHDMLLAICNYRWFRDFPTLKPKYNYLFSIDGAKLPTLDDPHFEWVTINESGKIFVVDSGSHQIHVFNKDGVYYESIGSFGFKPGELNRPQSMAFNSRGNMVISDNGNYRIQLLCPDGQFQRKFGNKLNEVRPAGWHPYTPKHELELSDSFTVTMANDGSNIIVVDRAFQRIQLRNSNGSLIRMFPSPHAHGFGKNFQPIAASLNPNGDIVVCNAGDGGHKVYIFTPFGELLRSFGKDGTEKKGFFRPWGVTVDTDGKIVISDSGNKQLQIYSNEGEFLMKVPVSGGILGPRCSTLDQEGRILYVDTKENKVQVWG